LNIVKFIDRILYSTIYMFVNIICYSKY